MIESALRESGGRGVGPSGAASRHGHAGIYTGIEDKVAKDRQNRFKTAPFLNIPQRRTKPLTNPKLVAKFRKFCDFAIGLCFKCLIFSVL